MKSSLVRHKVSFPALNPGWLSTPAERSSAFLPAFVRMSVAIQSILRERVPADYFQDAQLYRDLKTAAPMVVFEASAPFRGKKRTELTYDVMNPVLMAMLFRRAKPRLPELLVRVEARLRAENLSDLAGQYSPRRSSEILNNVQELSKLRRYLYVLVRAESVLVDSLMLLSGLAELPPKTRTKRWTAFGKRWNFQLRRLYPGRDFTHLVPALLAACEQALRPDAGSEADYST
jgi:hypothetical protein